MPYDVLDKWERERLDADAEERREMEKSLLIDLAVMQLNRVREIELSRRSREVSKTSESERQP